MIATIALFALAARAQAGPVFRLNSRQEMGGHNHGGGAEAKSGGGMGMGGFDITNPTISNMISNALYYGAILMPKIPVNKTETLKPQSSVPGAKRVRLYYGPMLLESAAYKLKIPNKIGLDPQGNTWYSQAANFPTDISVLASKINVADINGKPLGVKDGVYNHHTVVADAQKAPNAFVACPGKSAAGSVPVAILASAGEEGGQYKFTTDDPKFSGGYYLGKGDRVALFAEIVNYANTTRDVYTTLDMEYVEGKTQYEVSAEAISVTQCDGTSIGLKPAAGQMKFGAVSKEMTIQMDGVLFGSRGHLHDGGDYLKVIVNGKEICTSQPEYFGKAGDAKWDTIKEMTTCKDPIPVKKGDKLVIDAGYDLNKHPARSHLDGNTAEEMGVLNVQFARLRDTK
ncbi:hypothetical protein BT63DRAFT_438319 [Microthyrium microscopicum]|uniref:Uncharacterized protein n=1 Tax=Microthyrium microscopicum TaxID=703497 RepID=A0A6A6UEI7_9PEZI|nr:hypothetical protein BT63DRAFT_438319 [Microthyrium microscopicum]